MLRTILGLVLFGIILLVVALNYERLLLLSQTHELQSSARTAISGKRWEKVIGIYENGRRRYPRNPDIATRLAWAYRQAERPDKAEILYRQVLKRQPDHLNARLGLADLLRTDPGRINEAVDQLRLAVAKTPENPVLLTQIGDLYATAADNPKETRNSVQQWLYAQAAYYYEQSLKRNPKQFQASFRLGVAYQNLRRLQPSARAYCDALSLNPGSYQARYNLGMALTALRFREEGYRQMDRAVAELAEEGRMKTAMWLAQQVQNVKNTVYQNAEDAQPGQAEPKPTFLEPACLSPKKSPT
jgi:tetratricopeptide (TPR) repeat protein